MELIHFLANLLHDPLMTLQNLLSVYDTQVYLIIALIVFVETGLIVMPILPGDSLLFASGLLAASTGKLELSVLIPLLIGAALMGDNVNYWFGKHFARFVKSRERILFFKHEYIDQTHKFYQIHGGKAVILARFVPIVRTVAPFVAGAGRMKYLLYLFFCISGATLWVSSLTLLGYFLGTNLWVKQNFEKVVLGIVVLSITPILWHTVKSRLQKIRV